MSALRRRVAEVVVEPNYRPFTDSILTDIAALGEDARWELISDLRVRYLPSALRVEWSPVLVAFLIPLMLMVVYFRVRAGMSDFHGGVLLGLATTFGVNAVLVFIGSVGPVLTARRLRRADLARQS